MPPKGWRKNADGTYPLSTRAREIKLVDEILFPKATVVRLAKEAFPEGTAISKDSAQVLQRCATVYVNYIAEYARGIARLRDRTLLTADDVLEAFSKVGLDEFTEVMKKELAEYAKIKEAKKQAKQDEKNGESVPIEVEKS